jgi:transglycosylase-like protein
MAAGADAAQVLRQSLRWLVVALRLLAKAIAVLIVAVVVALVLGFATWDLLYFQPQRPKIDQLIASATEEERNPPEAIVRLVRADSGHGVALAAHWVLVRDPTDPTNRKAVRSSFEWNLHGVLWWTCVWLHLSEREQIALIVSRSYMGRDMRGYSAGSQAIFNRPLALLSLEEAATLVAIPSCANCFHDKRKGWDQRRDWLLSKVQAGP